jgi:SAM-dependent methyltransferase
LSFLAAPNPYGEFYDSRLVAIYDSVCPIDGYRDFYLELAQRLTASTIVDIGCGSGLLTCELAKQGARLIGVEPSTRMLELARHRAGGESVTWIHGGVQELGTFQADLAIMTGHVAQFFLSDGTWDDALRAMHRALKPGGYLAFESRNPSVQPWADQRNEAHVDWPSVTSRRAVHDPIAGRVDVWVEIVQVKESRVLTDLHYLFRRTGEELVSRNELRFRTNDEITQSLASAGFAVEQVYGNWDWSLADLSSPEFIFVARR